MDEDHTPYTCNNCDLRFGVIICRDAEGYPKLDKMYCPRCGEQAITKP